MSIIETEENNGSVSEDTGKMASAAWLRDYVRKKRLEREGSGESHPRRSPLRPHGSKKPLEQRQRGKKRL